METESALEMALKSRQSEAPMQPTQTSTSTEGVPLSTTTTAPPTGQTSEVGPSTSAPTTAPDQGPILSMQNMVKELEALEA